MATAHLYEDGKEVCGRTMVLKRHVNIESIDSWWRVVRKTLEGKDIPLTYESVQIDVAWIRFDIGGNRMIMVDRKRSMV